MAVTAREQQMLDLQEEGLTHQAISARVGVKLSYVHRTLGMLSGSPAEDRRREAAIRRGSERLGQAVNAAGGHR